MVQKGVPGEELHRQDAQDGKRLMHAALRVNRGVFMLCDDFPEWKGRDSTPQGFGGSPVTLHLELKKPSDVDKLVENARKHGATIKTEPQDMFWGDRYAQLIDPYGHNWSIGAPKAEEEAAPGTRLS